MIGFCSNFQRHSNCSLEKLVTLVLEHNFLVLGGCVVATEIITMRYQDLSLIFQEIGNAALQMWIEYPRLVISEKPKL